MRNQWTDQLNTLLVDIYESIQDVEQQMLKNAKLDLSISELHTLEAIADAGDAGSTISALAQALCVTMPTVTVAVQKLERKHYVSKVRSAEDGRQVLVVLTRSGRRVDAVHRYFHRQLVRSFIKEASEEEMPLLISALTNLQTFLHQQVDAAANSAAALYENNSSDEDGIQL